MKRITLKNGKRVTIFCGCDLDWDTTKNYPSPHCIDSQLSGKESYCPKCNKYRWAYTPQKMRE